MKRLDLKEIKEIELGILLHFKSFCEKNHIRYYLSNGTLLGAVKYRGFIPWDDDIDVFVPREDYDRLVRLYSDSETYKLFSLERCSKFRFPFAKLCDMTTRKEEEESDSGLPQGLDIDIFPLDCTCANREETEAVIVKNQNNIEHLIWSKLRFTKSRSIIRSAGKLLVMGLHRLYGAARICRRMIRIAQTHGGAQPDYVGCLVWPIYGAREIIPAEAFSQTGTVEFENERFPAPAGYDTYLRSLYGDYEQDPPPEKQKTHHKFTAYRL